MHPEEPPNRALQRTRSAVTAAASGLRLAATTQPPRQLRASLSLPSLGASTRDLCNRMCHRNLSLVTLASLGGLLETIFTDEAVCSSPRLTDVVSNAKFFFAEAQKELEGLVREYDDLSAKVYPLQDDEKA